MKKIAVFSVGSGGHVLPAKNIINELIDIERQDIEQVYYNSLDDLID